MTIGLICSQYQPKSNAVSIRCTSFADTWSQIPSCNLVVFTEGHKNARDFDKTVNYSIKRVLLESATNKHSIRFRIINEWLLSILFFFKILFSKKLDIYVVSSPPLVLATAVKWALKIKKAPFVADIRDPYPQVLFETNTISSKGFLASLLLKMEQSVYSNASGITTVTHGFMEHITKRSSTPIELIHNGMDPAIFTYQARNRLQVPFVIGFIGILGRFQHIEWLIEYAKFLKNQCIDDIRILVIGDGPKQNLLESALKEFQLDSHIDYHGFQPFNQIPMWLYRCHVGLSVRIPCNISETAFPVKIYEYMATGIPVAVSPISDAGDFVETNQLGIQFQETEMEKFHQFILALKNDDAYYHQLSMNAYRASIPFHRPNLAKQFYSFLEKTVEKEKH